MKRVQITQRELIGEYPPNIHILDGVVTDLRYPNIPKFIHAMLKRGYSIDTHGLSGLAFRCGTERIYLIDTSPDHAIVWNYPPLPPVDMRFNWAEKLR